MGMLIFRFGCADDDYNGNGYDNYYRWWNIGNCFCLLLVLFNFILIASPCNGTDDIHIFINIMLHISRYIFYRHNWCHSGLAYVGEKDEDGTMFDSMLTVINTIISFTDTIVSILGLINQTIESSIVPSFRWLSFKTLPVGLWHDHHLVTSNEFQSSSWSKRSA